MSSSPVRVLESLPAFRGRVAPPAWEADDVALEKATSPVELLAPVLVE